MYADSRGLIINDGNDANKQRRRALLLYSAGQAVQDIFMTLPDTGTAKEYQKAVDALNIHFIPKVNTSQARNKFRNTEPEQNQSVLQYVVNLKRMGVECDFHDMDQEIADRVQYKYKEEYFQRRLGEEKEELTLT